MVTSVVQNQAGQDQGTEDNAQQKLILDGLKMRVLKELQQGDGAIGSNPVSAMYSSAENIAGKFIDQFGNLAPALYELAQMIQSKDKALNALIAKQIGIKPDKLISEREAVSWNAIQQKRKEAEEAEEDVEREEGKRDLREIMKKQQQER